MTFGKVSAKLAGVTEVSDGFELKLTVKREEGARIKKIEELPECVDVYEKGCINRATFLWILLEHLAKERKDAAVTAETCYKELVDGIFSKLSRNDEINYLYNMWHG